MHQLPSLPPANFLFFDKATIPVEDGSARGRSTKGLPLQVLLELVDWFGPQKGGFFQASWGSLPSLDLFRSAQRGPAMISS